MPSKMRAPADRGERRRTALAFLLVLVIFAAVASVARPLEQGPQLPIVATAFGEQDCMPAGDRDLEVESVDWSRGRLIVEASHFFPRGARQSTEPKYTLSGTHLHIGWTWALPPPGGEAGCRARHRVHIEIRGLSRARYTIHLEPIISMH